MSSHLFLLCLIMPLLVFCNARMHPGPSTQVVDSFNQDKNSSIKVSEKAEQIDHQFNLDGTCTNRDISISQSKDSTGGIPRYIVEIQNTCVSACGPQDIHLHCGEFASSTLVNPQLFKRISFDDCLVNGGKALTSGQIISFTYSNTFMYPLTIKSARFC